MISIEIVESFKCSDGRLFEFKKDTRALQWDLAKAHEARVEFRQWLDTEWSYNMTSDVITDLIFEHWKVERK